MSQREEAAGGRLLRLAAERSQRARKTAANTRTSVGESFASWRSRCQGRAHGEPVARVPRGVLPTESPLVSVDGGETAKKPAARVLRCSHGTWRGVFWGLASGAHVGSGRNNLKARGAAVQGRSRCCPKWASFLCWYWERC